MSAAIRLQRPSTTHLAGRYRIRELLLQRSGVTRHLASDESTNPPTPVQLVREPLPDAGHPALPSDGSAWPNLAWEERLLSRCRHRGLPRIVGRFVDDNYSYLALEIPAGIKLWDAWEDSTRCAREKYGWLVQLADLLRALHAGGAILECLRPDQLVLTPSGHIVLANTSHLLPMPLPADAPLAASFSTSPELLTGAWIDARSDQYCVGALIYALLLGRELSDVDFIAPGVLKPFLERWPDVHPLIGRLLSMTLASQVEMRFPTLDHRSTDATGFGELILVLEQCRETLGRARVEVASWSTTGMVRSGNEDAFAVVHTSAGRQDSTQDFALVLVADGMGGSAAGEVAAALAVRELYHILATQPPFRCATFADSAAPNLDSYRQRIADALNKANQAVYTASRQDIGRLGMGCTAEAVFTDGRRLVIGHVGDSRAYLYRAGAIEQLTCDHTIVSRLVESGEITAEDAETHSRRAELHQALGGWIDVEPELIDVPIAPGDWILVCSDGLSNLVKPDVLRDVFERTTSADSAARRFVNLANLAGAPDNATAVVIRAF